MAPPAQKRDKILKIIKNRAIKVLPEGKLKINFNPINHIVIRKIAKI